MNVNDRRKNRVPVQKSMLKNSRLWLFMSSSFDQAELCWEGRWHFLRYLWSQNLPATEIKKKKFWLFLLIKYEQSWETIWNASVQFDKQDWVEICDLNSRLCFCCHLVLIKPPRMDMDPAVLLDSLFPFLTSLAVLEEPQFLSWPETHVRIYSNLYWSFQKFS